MQRLDRKPQSIIYLVPFIFFVLFFFISYARIVSTTPGQSNSLPKQQPTSILGEPNWCEKCQSWKPDRAHHCRVCNSCVLKMDQ